MKNVSLKKLGLSYLALFTLCFTGITSQAQGSSVVDLVDDAFNLSSRSSSSSYSSSSSSSSDRHHHHHHQCNCPINDHDLLLRTSAVQQGIDAISKFALRFSAAVRAGEGGGNNEKEVRELLETLTKEFFVEIIIPQATFTATKPAELKLLIDTFAALTTFDSSLTGNFSLEKYHVDRKGRRSLQFESLEYVVQTPVQIPGGPLLPSLLIAALDQYHVVETKPDVFKVKRLVADTIGVIPLGLP